MASLHKRGDAIVQRGLGSWSCKIDWGHVDEALERAHNASLPRPASPRALVFELHEACTGWVSQELPRITELRTLPSARVFLTTLVRSPFSHSLSAWMCGGKPSFGRFNRTIDYWLPYNMQSNQLLHGDFDRFMMGNKEPMGKRYRHFGEAEFNRTLDVVRRFDLVCTTEELAPCMERLLQELGLPFVRIGHAAPAHGRMGAGTLPADESKVVQEECTAKGLDCAAIVAERTRYDARLYAHALGLWSVARTAPVGIARLPPIGHPPFVAERRTGGAVAPTLPLGNHRVAFLHYHKTGHDLSPLLAKRASRFLDGVQFSGRVTENKRSAFSHPLNCHSAKDIQVWTAPDIALRASPVPSCYFVVQFIRDPSDWAISYYDYPPSSPNARGLGQETSA